MSPTAKGKAVVHYIYKNCYTPTVKADAVDKDKLCVDTATTEQVDWSTKFPVDASSVVTVIWLFEEVVGGVRIPVKLNEKD